MKLKAIVLSVTTLGVLVLIGANIWLGGPEGIELSIILANIGLVSLGCLVWLWGHKK